MAEWVSPLDKILKLRLAEKQESGTVSRLLKLHGTKGVAGYELMHPQGTTMSKIATALYESGGQKAVVPNYNKAEALYLEGHSPQEAAQKAIQEAVSTPESEPPAPEVPEHLSRPITIKGVLKGYAPPGSTVYTWGLVDETHKYVKLADGKWFSFAEGQSGAKESGEHVVHALNISAANGDLKVVPDEPAPTPVGMIHVAGIDVTPEQLADAIQALNGDKSNKVQPPLKKINSPLVDMDYHGLAKTEKTPDINVKDALLIALNKKLDKHAEQVPPQPDPEPTAEPEEAKVYVGGVEATADDLAKAIQALSQDSNEPLSVRVPQLDSPLAEMDYFSLAFSETVGPDMTVKQGLLIALKKKLDALGGGSQAEQHQAEEVVQEITQPVDESKISVGGVSVTPAELAAAIHALEQSKSNQVKPPLAKIGSPLVEMDYHGLAATEKTPDTNVKQALLVAMKKAGGDTPSASSQQPEEQVPTPTGPTTLEELVGPELAEEHTPGSGGIVPFVEPSTAGGLPPGTYKAAGGQPGAIYKVFGDGSASSHFHPGGPVAEILTAEVLLARVQQGMVLDDSGSSVVLPGQTPTSVYLFGSSEKLHVDLLAGIRDEIATGVGDPFSDTKLALGMPSGFNFDALFEWAASTGITTSSAERQAIVGKLTEMIHAIGTTATPNAHGINIPVNDDAPQAASLFTFDGNGYAQPYSGEVNMPQSGDALTAKIKAISQEFGDGKIIGQATSQMTTTKRQAWLHAFYQGDMAKVYENEGSKKNNPQHPGHPDNTGTHKIVWQPAVAGEVPVGVDVPGDWSPSAQKMTQAEVDNYLIAANMGNPRYLNKTSQENWVRAHRQGNVIRTNRLSWLAQERASESASPLSPQPQWTENLQPAPSYAGWVEGGNDPAYWTAVAVNDYLADHDLEEQASDWPAGQQLIKHHLEQQATQAAAEASTFTLTPTGSTPAPGVSSLVMQDKHGQKWVWRRPKKVHVDSGTARAGKYADAVKPTGLTNAESHALSTYGTKVYKIINPFLHQNEQTWDVSLNAYRPVTPQERATAEKNIALLDSAFAKAPPLAESIIVHRRVGEGIFGSVGSHVNGAIINNGFTSTSTSPGAATGHGYGYESKNIHMEIVVPAGTRVLPGNSFENEIILNRDAGFVVTSDKLLPDGTRHVQLTLAGAPETQQAEHEAHTLARLWGFQTAESRLYEHDDTQGVAQRLLDGDQTMTGIEGASFNSLTADQIADVTKEHVLDWALDNDDAHAENMLIMKSGAIVGIGKSRAFRLWTDWQGLNRAAMDSHAQLVYSRLYDAIAAQEVDRSKVDFAYTEAIKRATKMQQLPDATLRESLERAYAGLIPDDGEREALIQKGLDRKNSLVADVETMWDGIYHAAEWDKPTVQAQTEVANKQGHAVHLGYSPQAIAAVDKTKSHGTAVFVAGHDIEDSHMIMWQEHAPNGDKITRVGGKVRGKKIDQLREWLAARATAVGSEPVTPSGEPTDAHLAYGNIIRAARHISRHQQDQQFNPDSLAYLESTKVTLLTRLMGAESVLASGDPGDVEPFRTTYGDPEAVRDMAKHYLGLIEFVEKVKEEKGTTQPSDLPKWVYVPKVADEVAAKEPDVTVEKINASRAQGTFDTQNNLKLDGTTYHDGNNGKMYRVTLPTGEVIEFRSENGTVTTQQGQLEFTIPKSADTAGSLERIHKQLAVMGLTVQAAEPRDLELFYWRHLASIMASRVDSHDDTVTSSANVQAGAATKPEFRQFWQTFHQRLNALNHQHKKVEIPGDAKIRDFAAISDDVTPEEEVELWREAFATFTGRGAVDAFVAEGRHLPQFGHYDLDNPEEATGRPFWQRFDITEKDVANKKMLSSRLHQQQGEKGPKAITGSGGMFSTEGRMRVLGQWLGGNSSTSDQGYGSSEFVYLRQNQYNPDVTTAVSMPDVMVSPRVLLRTSNYAFSHDEYGRLSRRLQGGQSSGAHFGLAKHSSWQSGDNELMTKHSLSILDDIEILHFSSPAERTAAIQLLKDKGITEIRGIPVEQRFLFRYADDYYDQLKATLTAVQATW